MIATFRLIAISAGMLIFSSVIACAGAVFIYVTQPFPPQRELPQWFFLTIDDAYLVRADETFVVHNTRIKTGSKPNRIVLTDKSGTVLADLDGSGREKRVVPTDVDISDTDHPSGVRLKIAALQTGAFLPLTDVLTMTPIVFPGFGAGDLYTALDLSLYSSISFNIDDNFTISGGTSPLLPGFYFSSSPITADPKKGYTSDSPFTGTVVVNRSLGIAITPEPNTWFLVACCSGALIIAKRRFLKG